MPSHIDLLGHYPPPHSDHLASYPSPSPRLTFHPCPCSLDRSRPPFAAAPLARPRLHCWRPATRAASAPPAGRRPSASGSACCPPPPRPAGAPPPAPPPPSRPLTGGEERRVRAGRDTRGTPGPAGRWYTHSARGGAAVIIEAVEPRNRLNYSFYNYRFLIGYKMTETTKRR